MDLLDVRINGLIHDPSGNEYRVVGIDYIGTNTQRGPRIILHTGRVVNLKELLEFQCNEKQVSCGETSSSPEPTSS